MAYLGILDPRSLMRSQLSYWFHLVISSECSAVVTGGGAAQPQGHSHGVGKLHFLPGCWTEDSVPYQGSWLSPQRCSQGSWLPQYK